MKVVHAGFDGLDVAFQGALPAASLADLERAKVEAQTSNGDALAIVGRGKIAMHVAETGARGGYAYRTDTGPDGETWFFKRGSNPTDWNIRVSVKSLTLAIHGLEGVKAKLYETLEGIGATVLAESIGRVDFAVDLLAPDFALDPARFVAHWHCRYAEHAETRATDNDGAISIQYRSRRVTSVTVGTMPNRQVIVYDKRAEVIARRKDHWWKIWGLDRADKDNRVWRVELRAGKRHLKETWGISTWADLDAAICDVFKAALSNVRYVSEGQTDTNVTRQSVDAIWQATIAEVETMLADNESGLCPSDFKEGRRAQFRHTYEALFAGLAASYAVVRDLPDTGSDKVAEAIAASVVDYVRNNANAFAAKVERARKRLIFIGEGDGHAGSVGRVGEAH